MVAAPHCCGDGGLIGKTRRMSGLEIFGIGGVGEIEPGADLAEISASAARDAGTPLQLSLIHI